MQKNKKKKQKQLQQFKKKGRKGRRRKIMLIIEQFKLNLKSIRFLLKFVFSKH